QGFLSHAAEAGPVAQVEPFVTEGRTVERHFHSGKETTAAGAPEERGVSLVWIVQPLQPGRTRPERGKHRAPEPKGASRREAEALLDEMTIRLERVLNYHGMDRIDEADLGLVGSCLDLSDIQVAALQNNVADPRSLQVGAREIVLLD